MREIKFRVWDAENTRYRKHTDIENNYIDSYTHLINLSGELQDVNNTNCILEQYTGFKDKNGVEIYEGDIVTYSEGVTHWNDDYSGNTVVEFEDGCFLPFGSCEFSMSIEESLVIGNIHENKELIE